MFESHSPIEYVFLTLAIFGCVALIGGAVALFGGVVRTLVLGKPPLGLWQNHAERKFLAASIVTAFLGSAWLFLAPAYSVTGCTSSIAAADAEVTTTRESTVGPNGEPVEVITWRSTVSEMGAAGRGCEDTYETFYEANGPGVIPLFTLPVAVTFLPLAFYGFRVRAIVEAFLALILGGQMAIGMTLYGAAFGPSGVFMLLAALAALRTNAAQHVAPGNV